MKLGGYILFIFGDFEDYDDIEFFCLNILGDSPKVKEVKYIFQNLNNLIVILESDSDKEILTTELNELLKNDHVNFYFVFELKDIFMVNIPEKIKDIVFKPVKFLIEKNSATQILDLDIILEKIQNFGLSSLTEDEKNFLDNFKF
jgi:hypothetical protein